HPSGIERLGAFHLAALLQNQLQNVADVFVWAEDVGLYNRFPNFVDDARGGQVSRIINKQFFSARGQHFVDHAWACRDDVHVVLAAEPFLDNLHVQQTEKAAAKTKAQSDRAFWLIDKRGIVQAQLADRGLQMFEVAR